MRALFKYIDREELAKGNIKLIDEPSDGEISSPLSHFASNVS